MFEFLKKNYHLDAIKIRRDLHKIPEVGFEEIKTSNYIYEFLSELGLSPKKIIDTGVICYIDYGSKETIAFRADIDALTIEEENDVEYKSTHKGLMHACGHDAHGTILLLFAKYLKENVEKNNKNILLMFQPAEEGPGGAEPMLKEGIFKEYNVVNCFGLHVSSNYPEGKVACKEGYIFASTTELYIDIEGMAAHGASPHQGIDAIVIASQFINGVQTIVSRNIDPIKEGLVTIGTINGGDRLNIIPRIVKMTGTIRAMEKETKDLIVDRIESLRKGLEISYNCKINIEFRHLYPAIYNDKDLYEKIKPALGKDLMVADITMGAEDFSYFALEVPSVYFLLGTRNEEKGFTYPAHNSRFDLSEESLLYGLLAYINILKLF